MRVRQQWLSNRQFRAIMFPVLAVAVMLFVGAAGCVSVRAQGVTSPARGFQPAGSYAVSDIETISTKNGNLMLRLPLVSLPAGRGGSSAGIGLYYNSKLYEAYTSDGHDDEGNNIVLQQLRQSPEGGWRYGLGYSLTLLNLNDYRLEGFTCNTSFSVNYIYKLLVNFPDGSSHILHRAGQAEYGGFSRNRPDGWVYDCATNSNSPAVTGPMVYYSTDGSYLRLVVDHDSDGNWQNNTWTLHLPDGSRATGSAPTAPQRIYDRNNNFIEIRDAVYNNHRAKEVVDEFDRLLRIEYDDDLNQDYITQRGPDNTEVKWTVEWTSEFVFKTCYAVEFPQGDIQEQSGVTENLRVVSKITMPSAAGSLTYEFNYNAEPSTGKDGWGELSFIKLPGGAEVSYSYNMDGLDLDTNPVTFRDVLENFPTEKVVTHDNIYDDVTTEATERWTYNAIRGPYNAYTTFEIQSPDGGITREKFSETEVFPKQYAGQPYRTENPDGTVTERVYAGNVPYGTFPTQSQSADDPWNTNPLVTKKFRSVRDASGFLSKTAMTEYAYDKNGNVTEVKEYDWVPYSNLSHDSSGRPLGLTTNAVLKRVSANGYYNATGNSSDSSTDYPNTYHQSSAPRQLHLLATTEVRDAASTLSRSELYYDTLERGNLTEQRSWDSSNGALTRPLTAGRYVSVSSQYDAYGNLTYVTDANGNQTQLTYEPVNGVPDLYPTKIIKAFGTPAARTTLQEFDFYTGLVTRATDPGNDASTVTVYDGIGRPTLVRAAADTPEEVRTVTVYADAERRVVTRTDLNSMGDGKLVSIKHYDQMGRIRLSRTLEDASTPQGETDESVGIKVQTRYLIDRTAHQSYRLVSSAYRAAKSSLATNETTMGWALSTFDQGGRPLRAESFRGAVPPAPFAAGGAANPVSTGVVLTAYDAESLTVTDQALTRRRSVVDGLGRLVRVDEPDKSSGALDDANGNPVQPTSYTYDALGNLTQVTQGVQSRTFVYNSLSRLTTATNPEMCHQGQTQCVPVPVTYDYNPDGSLFHKTDARGVVTTYNYDALGRVTARSYSDETPDVVFTYDSQPLPDGAPALDRGKSSGRLVAVTYGGGILGNYSGGLDRFGRPHLSRQITDGGPSEGYTFVYDYYLNGRLKTQGYPSGKIVETQYDAVGRVAGVKKQNDLYYAGGDPGILNNAEVIKYTPHGAVSALRLGNGLWEHTDFNSNLQVTQMGLGTAATDSSTLRLDYTYGTDDAHNNGNVRTQAIKVPWLTQPYVQTYGYDKLNRLNSAEESNTDIKPTPTWKQVYAYDQYGNRTLDSGTIHPAQLNGTTNPAVSPADNRITSPDYSYDDAGNLLCDPV